MDGRTDGRQDWSGADLICLLDRDKQTREIGKMKGKNPRRPLKLVPWRVSACRGERQSRELGSRSEAELMDHLDNTQWLSEGRKVNMIPQTLNYLKPSSQGT